MILASTMRKLQEKNAEIFCAVFGSYDLRKDFPDLPENISIVEGGYELFTTKAAAEKASKNNPCPLLSIEKTFARNYCWFTGKRL